MTRIVLFLLVSLALASSASAENYVQLKAKDKYERTKIVNLGVDIEVVHSDSVFAEVSDKLLQRIKDSGIPIIETFKIHQDTQNVLDFPAADSRFHNYAELTKELQDLVDAHKDMLKMFSIGKSFQGRDLWCVQINTSKKAREATGNVMSAKPGIVFMGNHHAREHVSAEIPLMLLEYLVNNYGKDRQITDLVDRRDIYIIPMVNPDGAEYDIADGSYKSHRKNMRPNGTDNPGVDLNRNYGYGWGTGGSSTDASSDIYMGEAPFSEPETQAIKAFVEAHPNLKVLLSYHTYSELILYPWGGKNDPITNKGDFDAFKSMATKMAEWNHYTPEQSSDLYIASGDTCDWAYGQLGIFAFTFELSPREMWDGGFYPGAGVLDKVFDDNLKPALYLIDLADDPHRASKHDDRLSWLD